MSSLKDIFSVSRKRYILHCKPTEIETHMRKTKKNLFPRTIKPEIFKEQVGLSELSHLHTPIQGHAFKWSQNIWMTCEPLGTFWAQIWQLGFLPHSPSLPCLALSHGPQSAATTFTQIYAFSQAESLQAVPWWPGLEACSICSSCTGADILKEHKGNQNSRRSSH